MKKELQEKLFKEYPGIFRQKDMDKSKTAMSWGISCGDGWYVLIDNLCANIQNRMLNVNRGKPKEAHLICEAVQVKEKFGGLRFYTQGCDDYIAGVIGLAESMSYHICSACGNPSSEQKSNRGWIHPHCNECKEKRNKESAEISLSLRQLKIPFEEN